MFDSSQHFLYRPEKLKIKWLLLSCRLLLLSCIIIAFALILQQRQENATNEMYIILDNSFSMQAKGGELIKRPFRNYLKRLRKHYFSLLTNSENFGIPILNQFTASKPKIQRFAILISPYHGK
jgi:hypothetical protein